MPLEPKHIFMIQNKWLWQSEIWGLITEIMVAVGDHIR